MQRTCESIARLKIAHKQRTKCCNLQHFALSDGKNPRKYHSFCPRMWLKHYYLQVFVHVMMFDFLKNAQIPYQRFFCAHQNKKSVQQVKHGVIYKGLAPSRANDCVNTNVFCVQKWPKHRYLQWFVPSTFSWDCKNRVNASIFCDQPANNAVIYRVFVSLLSRRWYLQCFVHL